MINFEGAEPRLKNILKSKYLRSNVAEKDLDTYRSIIKIVRSFIPQVLFKPPGKGMFLYGSNGAGKSYIAAAVANELESRKRIRTFRVTVPAMMEEYYECWRLPEFYSDVPCLVLEELNKDIHTKNEHSESVVENLLKARFEVGHCTIITSNSPIERIVRRYGETVESLLEGRCVKVCFPDVDLRVIQNKRFLKKIDS